VENFCAVLKLVFNVERVKGIEPSSQAWEAHILPLNHTRIYSVIKWNTPDIRLIQGRSFAIRQKKHEAMFYDSGGCMLRQ
jgi:hypothetical protein